MSCCSTESGDLIAFITKPSIACSLSSRGALRGSFVISSISSSDNPCFFKMFLLKSVQKAKLRCLATRKRIVDSMANPGRGATPPGHRSVGRGRSVIESINKPLMLSRNYLWFFRTFQIRDNVFFACSIGHYSIPARSESSTFQLGARRTKFKSKKDVRHDPMGVYSLVFSVR